MSEHNAEPPGNLRSVLASHQKWFDFARQEIEALKKINAGILDHLGLMAGDYNRIHEKPEPKRTIKGGWVNVYLDECRFPGFFLAGPWKTKDDADSYPRDNGKSRIACIQIPDFEEGEGL